MIYHNHIMTGTAVAIEQITSRSWGSIFRRNFSRMYIQVFSSHLLFKVCLMQGDFKAIKIRIVFFTITQRITFLSQFGNISQKKIHLQTYKHKIKEKRINLCVKYTVVWNACQFYMKFLCYFHLKVLT